MSDMTSLPPHLAEAVSQGLNTDTKEIMEQYKDTGASALVIAQTLVVRGAEKLFTHLSERAGLKDKEVDKAAAEYAKTIDDFMGRSHGRHMIATGQRGFQDGARYQATIDQARIEGIDAQRKRFAKRVGELEAEVAELKKVLGDAAEVAWSKGYEQCLREQK